MIDVDFDVNENERIENEKDDLMKLGYFWTTIHVLAMGCYNDAVGYHLLHLMLCIII